MTIDELALRAVVDALPHLLWTCHADGRCDAVGRQWSAYAGAIDDDTDLADAWWATVHPDDVAATRAACTAAAAIPGVVAIELRLRRDDGTWRWFEARMVPDVDANGHVVRWLGSATDIDERREARAAASTLSHIISNTYVQ